MGGFIPEPVVVCAAGVPGCLHTACDLRPAEAQPADAGEGHQGTDHRECMG